MEQLLENKIPSLLKKEDIIVNDEKIVAKQLAYYTYTMVFNICAIIATHALIHDKKERKVTSECIKSTFDYVTMKCYSGKKQSGGSAELYNHMRDAEITDHLKRGGGITMFTIIFTKMTPNKELFPSVYLKEIFDGFGVSISPNFMKQVKHVLKMHLSCLLADIKKINGEVTKDKIDKVIKMKRHSVFL
jgi:hypothetical protein